MDIVVRVGRRDLFYIHGTIIFLFVIINIETRHVMAYVLVTSRYEI